MRLWKKSVVRPLANVASGLVAVLAVATGSWLSAQSDQPGTAARKVTFEVATVRQNKSGDRRQNTRFLPGGQLYLTNVPVRTMIGTAWDAEAIQTGAQVVGGPSWIDTDRYDVIAKTKGDPGDDRSALFAMLRSLLEERFLVKAHREMREAPVYDLVLAGKDPKFGTLFKRSTANCYTRESPPAPNTPPDPTRLCGIRGGAGNVTYVGVTMQEIARNLANYPAVARPVFDRTGLQGKYDLHIEFVPAFVDSVNGPPVPNPSADSGPNLFTALTENAGLKLQAARGTIDFIVIDRVERPIEN